MNSVWHTFIMGQKYLKIWPMIKPLASLFPEYRVIRATNFGLKFAPIVAVVSVSSQLLFNPFSSVELAVTIGLFFISLPLQGLYWLGQRAQAPLPLSLMDWCSELRQTLKAAGYAAPRMENGGKYLDLAQILNTAFGKLDEDYWREL
ncbi:terminus macrodomain insulation protein YfbV [Paraferrimonas sp. SM1919]|uniref:terminus macrodomain insulation protein YfbV n=1 Tax=Paraferrimonas sp. SM1919 TaxID=2662263 RepID=UPI0013D5FAF1|nr:terminus macrodomain insulation protein YfbV [Paraferrimonas sp. SM1919]